MVLIVDDNAFNLDIQSDLIKEKLNERLDIQDSSDLIMLANDGTVAVELVQNCLQKQCQCSSRVFKLIIMDMQMPKMNGNEATAIINELIKVENQKRRRCDVEAEEIVCNIVACTANTTDYWKDLAYDSGIVDMVHKPLTSARLDSLLDKWFTGL